MKYIVCNIDAAYYKHCATMLTSLFENNKMETFFVYILAIDVPLSYKQLLVKHIESYQNKVVFIDVDKNLVMSCPIYKHDYPSVAVYLRLFIPQYLPQSVNKVLYVDCDVIFEGNIDELYNIDITHYALAAVEDAPNENPTRLKYDEKDGYFNSGVMLLNVSYLRDINFTENALAYISKHKNRIIFHDQDVMNALLHGKVLFLPIKWNLLDCYYHDRPNIDDKYLLDFQACKDSPVLIHFSGPLKPWHYGCHHPLRHLYFKYSCFISWGVKRRDYLYIFRKYKPLVALLICKGYTPYEAKDIRRKLLRKK